MQQSTKQSISPGKTRYELTVGAFLLVGLGCVVFMAVRLGDLGLDQAGHYEISARFKSASGLKVGAPLELAGVRIGRVRSIDVDPENYEAVVTLSIPDAIQLPEDTIASVRTQGIIGDKFLKLTPGGAVEMLVPGSEILDTEPSISLEELISKYIFDSGP